MIRLTLRDKKLLIDELIKRNRDSKIRDYICELKEIETEINNIHNARINPQQAFKEYSASTARKGDKIIQ